jgi:hypothetical protein
MFQVRWVDEGVRKFLFKFLVIFNGFLDLNHFIFQSLWSIDFLWMFQIEKLSSKNQLSHWTPKAEKTQSISNEKKKKIQKTHSFYPIFFSVKNRNLNRSRKKGEKRFSINRWRNTIKRYWEKRKKNCRCALILFIKYCLFHFFFFSDQPPTLASCWFNVLLTGRFRWIDRLGISVIHP